MSVMSCWRIIFLNKVFSVDELEFKDSSAGNDLTTPANISRCVFSDTEDSKVFALLNTFDNNPNDLTYLSGIEADIGWDFGTDTLVKFVTIDMRNTYTYNTSQFPDTVDLKLQYSGSRQGPWVSFSTISIPKASISNTVYTWDVLYTLIKQEIVGAGSIIANGIAQTFTFSGNNLYTLYKVSGRSNLTLNSYTITPVFNTFFFDGDSDQIITSSTITHLIKNTQTNSTNSAYLINNNPVVPDQYSRLLLK